MMKKIYCCIFTMLVFSGLLQAQSATVKGVVVDNQGPIIGATVIVKGTQVGTTTNMKGEFSINVPNTKGAILIANYLGYTPMEMPIGDKTTGIKIVMYENVSMLDDVVVIGYGTAKRADLTGAVASLSGEQIVNAPVASAVEAIKGRMAGVQVTSSDGSQDAEIMIRVRGGGSITQDNSPLYIVDGFPVESIIDVPPTEIESIDVLKDASSTAIYGSRGANGVVIISTKKPKAGRVSVNVNGYMQARTLSKKLDVLDPFNFVLMQLENDVKSSSTTSPSSAFIKRYGNPSDMYIYKGLAGTDYQEEILGGTVWTKNFNASVNGGSENVKYNVSFTRNIEPGVLLGNGQNKSNFNTKLNFNISKSLTGDFNFRFSETNKKGAGTTGGNVVSALRWYPTNGLKDFMRLPDDIGDIELDPEEEDLTRYPPTQENNQNYKTSLQQVFNINGALAWTIISGLVFKTEYGLEYNYQTAKQMWGLNTSTARNNNNRPVVQLTDTKSPRWRNVNTLTYSYKKKNQYGLTAMIGQEAMQTITTRNVNRVKYFPTEITFDKAFSNLALGTPDQTTSYISAPNRLASFFGRLNFDLKNGKYAFSASLRADGSTKFAPGRQWGYFPAGSFGWRISDENFMKNSTLVSNLKLRLAIGSAGNNRIDDDLWRNMVYAISYDKSPGWGGVLNPYYVSASTSMTNPGIQWETTVTRDVGVDFGFFKERLSGTVDVYWNTTKNLLYPQKLPYPSGFDNIISNVAQTSNRGVELTLNGYIIEKNDFRLSASFNISYNQNKIDKLASGETEWIIRSGSTDLRPQEDFRVFAGRTAGLMYGYVYDGFYTVDDFDFVGGKYVLKPGIVNPGSGLPITLAPGAMKIKKLTPVDMSLPEADRYTITDKDQTVIGNANPKFNGGFSINANYKNFDANLFFNYMYDFTVYNYNRLYLSTWWRNSNTTRYNIGGEFSGTNRFRFIDDTGNDLRYDPTMLKAFNVNAKTYNPAYQTNPLASSYIMEDGSFLRLNTATIGYTLPSRISKKIGMKVFRIYFTGYNLWCITGYTGYDPEVNIQKGMTPNMDNGVYPRSRTYTLGANITF